MQSDVELFKVFQVIQSYSSDFKDSQLSLCHCEKWSRVNQVAQSFPAVCSKAHICFSDTLKVEFLKVVQVVQSSSSWCSKTHSCNPAIVQSDLELFKILHESVQKPNFFKVAWNYSQFFTRLFKDSQLFFLSLCKVSVSGFVGRPSSGVEGPCPPWAAPAGQKQPFWKVDNSIFSGIPLLNRQVFGNTIDMWLSTNYPKVGEHIFLRIFVKSF